MTIMLIVGAAVQLGLVWLMVRELIELRKLQRELDELIKKRKVRIEV